MAVVPAGAGQEGEIVTETRNSLGAALADHPDCALLLRPDHYVAVAVPPSDAGGRAVEALLAATWEQAGSDAVPKAA